MSDTPRARNLLLDEFEESWNHIRHIEEQRWTLIKIFFALTTGLVTLVSALWKTGFFPPDIYIMILIVIAAQGILTIQVIMKLRLEFCLHMTNVNMIREFFAQHDGAEITKETDIFKGETIVRVFKPTSVHMGTIIPIGFTTTSVCLLIPYFYLKITFAITMTAISWINLFCLLYVSSWYFVLFLGTVYDSRYSEKSREFTKQQDPLPLPKTAKDKLLTATLLAIAALMVNTLLFIEVQNGFTLPFSFNTPYVFNQIFPISQNFPINIISISIYILNTLIGFIGTIFGIILIRRRQLMREGVIISFSSVGLSLFTGFLSGLALSLVASLTLIWIIKYDIPRDSYKS